MHRANHVLKWLAVSFAVLAVAAVLVIVALKLQCFTMVLALSFVSLFLAMVIVWRSLSRGSWSRLAKWAALCVLTGAYVLVIPLAYHKWPLGLWGTIATTFESVRWGFKTLVGGVPVGDAIKEMKDLVGGADSPITQGQLKAYVILLDIYTIAMPLLAVAALLDKFKTGLEKPKLWWFSIGNEVAYIFDDFDERTQTLVDSICKASDGTRTQFGVTERGTEKGSESDAVVRAVHHTLKDAYRHPGDPSAGELLPSPANAGKDKFPFIVICNTRVSASVKERLELYQASKATVIATSLDAATATAYLGEMKALHTFYIGADKSANVQRAAQLMKTLDEDDRQPQAEKHHVYCLSNTDESMLIFDALAQQKLREIPEDKRSEWLADRATLRLISEPRERMLNLLTEKPLFSVLNNGGKRLTVLIVGLGENGIEALKDAYWIGCMRDVRLRIIGIDKDADRIRAVLEDSCPEMFDLGKRRHAVSIIRADVETGQLKKTLDKCISADPESDERVYAIVARGNDELNLQTAIKLRRIFSYRGLEHQISSTDANTRRRTMIMPLIRGSVVAKAAESLVSDDKGAEFQKFELTPFGSRAEVFSYENIVCSAWEQVAVSVCAAYDAVHSDQRKNCKQIGWKADRQSTFAQYNSFEIKKLSNRVCARHIPYKLWSMGDHDTAMEVLAHWKKQLGVGEAQFEQLMTPWSLNSGITLEDERQAIGHYHDSISKLAALEHDRWWAFYQACGWRGITVEDVEELAKAEAISRKAHQSAKLLMHGYMCPVEELAARGEAWNDDPFVYDRAIVIELDRELARTVVSEV